MMFLMCGCIQGEIIVAINNEFHSIYARHSHWNCGEYATSSCLINRCINCNQIKLCVKCTFHIFKLNLHVKFYNANKIRIIEILTNRILYIQNSSVNSYKLIVKTDQNLDYIHKLCRYLKFH